jgi:hypothetical protein
MTTTTAATAEAETEPVVDLKPVRNKHQMYIIMRNGHPAEKYLSEPEVLNFLNACDVKEESLVSAIFAGMPVCIDKSMISFRHAPRKPRKPKPSVFSMLFQSLFSDKAGKKDKADKKPKK